MSQIKSTLPILIAEDDEDDILLIKETFAEVRLKNPLYVVKDGVELLEYLRHEGAYTAPEDAPRPGIILLDLNMPRIDGREALAKIKQDPDLKRIPVVVLTTSKEDEDVVRTYDMGVNSFIQKPVDFARFVEVVRAIGNYWFEIVEMPGEHLVTESKR